MTAFKAYEAVRLPATARLVRDNRSGGPERIIDVVEERVPDGFANLEDVAGHAELEAIVRGYARTAGFDQTQVNRWLSTASRRWIEPAAPITDQA